MTSILALDVATTCGWARGPVGDGVPTAGSIRFGKLNASLNAKLHHCGNWIEQQLDEDKPDIIALEALLSASFVRGRTNKMTLDTLTMMHGIIRREAYRRGIFEINAFPTSAIRAHFIDMNVCPRDKAKEYVFERCRQLGWLRPEHDDNCTDALATWSYQVSLLDPQHAIRISPLFRRRVAE
jgi:hypothetical protein